MRTAAKRNGRKKRLDTKSVCLMEREIAITMAEKLPQGGGEGECVINAAAPSVGDTSCFFSRFSHITAAESLSFSRI